MHVEVVALHGEMETFRVLPLFVLIDVVELAN